MVKDIDRGWAKAKKSIALLDRSYVKVGLPENGTVNPPEFSEGDVPGLVDFSLNFAKANISVEDLFPTMSDLVKIGAANEFGAPKRKIPERPFMRQSFDKNKLKILKVKDVLYTRVLRGQATTEKALGILGLAFTRLIQKEIRGGNFKKNAQSTIDKKGSSVPLIDNGQLINSIQHVVTLGGVNV